MESRTFKLKIGEKDLVIESKNLAEQANGNIFVRYGDTLVMTTCVMGEEDRKGLNFFPLTVEYEEKYYAAGKIKGPRYIKRESRPSDEAVCNARLIDRCIRPLFPKELKREVQVITTILSWDAVNDPDILGINAASLSLSISDIPWEGPVAAVRVCQKDGKMILNPSYEERENSELDIVFAGTIKNGELVINMIEGGAEEVEEGLIVKAFEFAQEPLKELIRFQEEIKEKIGKEKIVLPKTEINPSFEKEIKTLLSEKLEQAIYQKDKRETEKKLAELKEKLF